MNSSNIISGSDVKNLITKFYYKNNHLCFQILLQLGLDKMVPYSEYKDYAAYKEDFNNLLKAKSNNIAINMPNEKTAKTNVSFS
ncbi:MAG: hypothetical protein AB8G15_06825 [Saprospiraceae bacterium]